jgi:hypothetical protein
MTSASEVEWLVVQGRRDEESRSWRRREIFERLEATPSLDQRDAVLAGTVPRSPRRSVRREVRRTHAGGRRTVRATSPGRNEHCFATSEPCHGRLSMASRYSARRRARYLISRQRSRWLWHRGGLLNEPTSDRGASRRRTRVLYPRETLSPDGVTPTRNSLD